jgi:hypothetical protein
MVKNFVIPEEIVLKQKTRMFFVICSLLGIFIFFLMFFRIGQNTLLFIGEILAGREIVDEIWIERIRTFSMIGITCSFIIFITVIKKKINSYEILIFLFLVIQLLCTNNRGMDNHALSSYLLSYRYGFASRMFIGTIVDMLLGGGFISRVFLYNFVFSATLLLCFYVSVILGHIIQKSENHLSLFVLTILYLSSSISPAAYFVQGNFGRMEIYIFLFMLIIFTVVDKKLLRWFIPALCFMSIATHLVSIFFYMPLVFIILLYKYINKNNQDRSEGILLILTAVIITFSFLYFTVFSKSTLIFQTEGEFVNALNNRTDIVNAGSSLHYDYFLSIINTFRYAVGTFTSATAIIRKFYCILQNLPLFFFFVLFWKSCITYEQKRSMKLIFLLSLFFPLFSIPAFMLFIDWGRWVIMLLTVQFMLVFYFLHTREAAVVYTTNKLSIIVQKNMYAAVLFIMLSVFFGPIWQINSSENFRNLLDILIAIIKKILEFIKVN